MTAAKVLKPLRIGIVTASVSRQAGGVFDAVRACALGLAAIQNDVDIFSLSDARSEEDAGAWAPLVPELFARWGPRAFAYAPALAKTLLEKPLDLVHQHGLWLYPSISVSRFRARTGRPTVISPHGMLDPWALRNSAWKKRLARALFEDRNLAGSSCLHALNEAEARTIRLAGFGTPIAIIPNGVHLPSDAVPNTSDILPNADDRKVLLFIGRIHPKKGLTETIDAWAGFARRAPLLAQNWLLVLAGWDDGGYAAGLRRRIEELGLAHWVSLPGPVYGEQKAALFARASAFILASYSEGLPMSVLEAWSYRLPVFMTGACNLPEGFAAGAAIQISTKAGEIADVLGDRLGDPALTTIGEAGRALVEARFTWEAIVAEHVRTYEWLARGAPRPGCVTLQ